MMWFTSIETFYYVAYFHVNILLLAYYLRDTDCFVHLYGKIQSPRSIVKVELARPCCNRLQFKDT